MIKFGNIENAMNNLIANEKENIKNIVKNKEHVIETMEAAVEKLVDKRDVYQSGDLNDQTNFDNYVKLNDYVKTARSILKIANGYLNDDTVDGFSKAMNIQDVFFPNLRLMRKMIIEVRA